MLATATDAHPYRSFRPLFALFTLPLLVACGGCDGGTGTASASSGGASTSTSSGGASTSTSSGSGEATTSSTGTTSGSSGSGDAGPKVDRGPTTIPLDGDANGLFWDAAAGTLIIADDNHNRLLTWTDGGGIAVLADLPPAPPNGAGLGQVVKTKDGSLLVTRFGYGIAGDVVYVAADKSTGKVPNLDPARRRIGLAVSSDGAIFDTYFVKGASGQIGAVARLDLSGTETDVLPSLKKPVGVLVSGANLVVSDQSASTVVTAPIAAPDKSTVLAHLEGPDLLCEGPNGSFFTGSTTDELRQIASDGTVTAFARGFLSVRGVAYDAVNKRLFAAEHDPAGKANTLRIVPLD